MLTDQKLTSFFPGYVERDDWDFRSSDTRYSTHGMHTWLAAMIPPLARKLIALTSPSKLLDPFCGGGTVCVEGVLANVPTTGLDVNPLSAIVSKAKTTRVNEKLIEDTLIDILKEISSLRFERLLYPDYQEYRIPYWFIKEHLPILDSIARYIPEIKDQQTKTFFQCVFSATIRDVSLTYRNEIRLRRLEPHHLKKSNRDVLQVFKDRTKDAIIRLRTIPPNSKIKVLTGDVKYLPFEDNEFSTIICSPPYGDERNGVPYFQFVKNMLYWLGIPKRDLQDAKRNVLGWHNKSDIQKRFCPESKTLQKLIKEIENNKQNVSEAIAFYSDYEKGLKEMARVTSDKIIIVIGNRILNKKIVNNAAITTELFDNLGVKLKDRFVRDLPTKRIPRFGNSKLVQGGHIDKEDILIFATK